MLVYTLHPFLTFCTARSKLLGEGTRFSLECAQQCKQQQPHLSTQYYDTVNLEPSQLQSEPLYHTVVCYCSAIKSCSKDCASPRLELEKLCYVISSSSCCGRAFVLPDLPRADLSTELLAKGGVPLPIESKKELSSFRYSMALENSLKEEARQTFARMSHCGYQSLEASLVSHKAFLNHVSN